MSTWHSRPSHDRQLGDGAEPPPNANANGHGNGNGLANGNGNGLANGNGNGLANGNGRSGGAELGAQSDTRIPAAAPEPIEQPMMAGAATLLRRLWGLRLVLVPVLVLAVVGGLSTGYDIQTPLRVQDGSVQLRAPGLTPSSVTFGAAGTQLLVDSPRSSLGDAEIDGQPLVQRATVLSQFLLGEPVRRLIAARAGIPLSQLAVRGQINIQQFQSQREAPSEQRSFELLGEPARRTVLVRNDAGSSIISLFTQAPEARDAVRLANVAASSAQVSLERLQDEQRTPRDTRLVLRQLGPAQGGVVDPGSGIVVVGLVTLALFLAGCLLTLLGSSLRSALRAGNTSHDAAAKPRA